MKALTLAHEIKYMCMNTSPNVLERFKLLRLIGIDISSNQKALYRGVTQGDNSEIQKLYFRNERRHGTGNLKKKKRFLGHLQLSLDTNPEDLAILILELVTSLRKPSIVFFFLSRGPVWGSMRKTY